MSIKEIGNEGLNISTSYIHSTLLHINSHSNLYGFFPIAPIQFERFFALEKKDLSVLFSRFLTRFDRFSYIDS